MPRTAFRLLVVALAVMAARRAGRRRRAAATSGRPRREAKSASRSEGSAGTWLGAGGVAAALAAFGARQPGVATWQGERGVADAPRRGRSSLSPRHAIHLVRVGDRTLILGTGPQGAPALLGELDEAIAETRPAEPADPGRCARLAPAARPVAGPRRRSSRRHAMSRAAVWLRDGRSSC